MRPACTSGLNYIFTATQPGRPGILSDMETVGQVFLQKKKANITA